MSITEPTVDDRDSGCTVSAVRHQHARRRQLGHWQRARGSTLLLLRMHMDRGCGKRTCRNQPALGPGRVKVRVKSRQMPRQRSPSRLSCRLAAKQQPLGGLPTAAI